MKLEINEWSDVVEQIHNGVTRCLKSINDSTLPATRVRTLKLQFTFTATDDTRNFIEAILSSKGDLPMFQTVPFHLKLEKDHEGHITGASLASKKEAETNTPDQVQMFALTNGKSGGRKRKSTE